MSYHRPLERDRDREDLEEREEREDERERERDLEDDDDDLPLLRLDRLYVCVCVCMCVCVREFVHEKNTVRACLRMYYHVYKCVFVNEWSVSVCVYWSVCVIRYYEWYIKNMFVHACVNIIMYIYMWVNR